MLGALQSTKYAPGSIKGYLYRSYTNANSLSLIAQTGTQATSELAAQMADAAIQKRAAERLSQALALSKTQTNYTPPRQLDPVIYFSNGSSLDTSSNVLTRSDGVQIDVATGKVHVDEQYVIRMANGAYLDTKNNILTSPDGTRIDTISGLVITA
jgi:hypothetical protein